LIQIDGLTVAYGRTIALTTLDLVISEGVTGLFGPNAAGKSTLLRVLAGLLRPTRGRVMLNGRPVDTSDENFRRRIGYVGHDSGLYGRLSVRENLALFSSLYGTGEGQVDELIGRLDLHPYSGVRVEELSAGLKRRAAVARGLLHEPDVLLLDEPYANLDDDASELVSSAVKAWRRPSRIAVIATHGAKKVRAFADARIVLQRGRLASHLTPEMLEARA
jgi:heme exporter protein A